MKKNLTLVYRILSVLILELVTCPILGQELIPKQLTRKDYKSWSKLRSDKISDNGNWVSYLLTYDSAEDTLFVKNTNSQLSYNFPNSSYGFFSNENIFASLDKTKNLNVLNLNSGAIKSIPNVAKFNFSTDSEYLITHESDNAGSQNICFRKKDLKVQMIIKNVQDFQINETANILIFSRLDQIGFSVGIINLNLKLIKTDLVIETGGEVKNLTLSKDGTCAAFYAIENNFSGIYFYNRKNKKLSILKSLHNEKFNSKIIAESQDIPLKISDDNSAVYFSYKSSDKITADREFPEIWGYRDKYLFPYRKLSESYNKPYLAIWKPTTMKVLPISSEKFSWAALTGNSGFAVIADPSKYEPQYDLNPPMDYFILNTNTGQKELFLSRQSGLSSHMNFSPNGRFICYYKNKRWQLYDLILKKHRNVSANIQTDFQRSKEDSMGGGDMLYGFQGWTSDCRSFIVRDKYDLWQIFLFEKRARRLSKGKEQEITFNLYSKDRDSKEIPNYSGAKIQSINLKDKNILAAYDHRNDASGYYLFDSKRGLHPLILKKSLVSRILKAKKNDKYSFESENFNISPSILFKASDTATVKTIVETNLQQKKFKWGFSEVINFKNSQNKYLKGALFYPAGYDPKIKYPMIVHIYEKQTQKLHKYETPSFRNQGGFNITELTSNGYFVFLPDIEYERGNPAISASDCVISAVKMILSKGIVNPSKIGLIGHSFGGYETNFILTQSNLFAAAISGSGVSDNINCYFTLNREFNNAEIWRFENQQFRMGASFYDDRIAYLKNSPLLYADKINTPLLIWAGKNDNNVRPEQSITFYLALRRLGKKAVMIQYPGEGHVLFSNMAKEDLTDRIRDWFDYYLKGEEPKQWISENKSYATN